jgi:hypothetical protein
MMLVALGVVAGLAVGYAFGRYGVWREDHRPQAPDA